ncbi:MAG: hypothetical protein AMXMBFR64_58550 [Myxococcales bacterium]
MAPSHVATRLAVWLLLALTPTGCRKDAAPEGAGPLQSTAQPATSITETTSAPLALTDTAVWLQVPLRWRLLEIASPLPLPRDARGGVAIDFAGDRLVVVGGYKFSPANTGPLHGNDIWTLPFEPELQWAELPASDPRPTGRMGQVVIDPGRSRVILTLGRTSLIPNTKFLNDLWTYDLSSPNAFLPLRALAPRPLPVSPSHGAFVPPRNALVFHGGVRDSKVLSDTWMLELAEELPRWRHLSSGSAGMGSRTSGFHYYDPKRDMLIVVAGMRCYQGPCKVRGPLDAWALTGLSTPGGEEWVQLALDSELPTSAVGGRCAYDPKADRAVCQGLWLYPDWPTSDKYVDVFETWTIASTGPRSVRMRRLDVGGSEPPINMTDVHYDPKRDRFVFFGGWKKYPKSTSTTNDTWVLERRPDLASCTTAAALGEVAP